VELNVHHKTLRLHNPSSYERDDVNWQPFYYYNRLPCIRCRFEGGREGLFLLDTGAARTLEFYAPAVQHYDLLKDRRTSQIFEYNYAAKDRISTGGVGELEWFEMGGCRLANLKDVHFAGDGKEKPFTNRTPCGSIGLGLLEDFKVIFDYPHKRIAFIRLRDGAKESPTTQAADR
jgi:hypothetical protein